MWFESEFFMGGSDNILAQLSHWQANSHWYYVLNSASWVELMLL